MKKNIICAIVMGAIGIIVQPTVVMGAEAQREWSNIMESIQSIKISDIAQNNPAASQLLEKLRGKLNTVEAQKKLARLQEIIKEGASHAEDELSQLDDAQLSVKLERLKDMKKRLVDFKNKLSAMNVTSDAQRMYRDALAALHDKVSEVTALKTERIEAAKAKFASMKERAKEQRKSLQEGGTASAGRILAGQTWKQGRVQNVRVMEEQVTTE